MLWLEGERLRNLVIDEKSFHSERDVVKEELRQRVLSQPYGRILYTLIPAFLFDGHLYERPIGGSIADLDRAEQIGRASCRERVGHEVEISVVAGSIKQTIQSRIY